MKSGYWNKRLKQETRYLPNLRGLSHVELTRQRGLKGCKLGPANEGRVLTDAERLEVERKMRESGVI